MVRLRSADRRCEAMADPIVTSRYRRIKELESDGYVWFAGKMWFLTERGWSVLSACADRPMKKPPRRIPIKRGDA